MLQNRSRSSYLLSCIEDAGEAGVSVSTLFGKACSSSNGRKLGNDTDARRLSLEFAQSLVCCAKEQESADEKMDLLLFSSKYMVEEKMDEEELAEAIEALQEELKVLPATVALRNTRKKLMMEKLVASPHGVLHMEDLIDHIRRSEHKAFAKTTAAIVINELVREGQVVQQSVRKKEPPKPATSQTSATSQEVQLIFLSSIKDRLAAAIALIGGGTDASEGSDDEDDESLFQNMLTAHLAYEKNINGAKSYAKIISLMLGSECSGLFSGAMNLHSRIVRVCVPSKLTNAWHPLVRTDMRAILSTLTLRFIVSNFPMPKLLLAHLNASPNSKVTNIFCKCFRFDSSWGDFTSELLNEDAELFAAMRGQIKTHLGKQIAVLVALGVLKLVVKKEGILGSAKQHFSTSQSRIPEVFPFCTEAADMHFEEETALLKFYASLSLMDASSAPPEIGDVENVDLKRRDALVDGSYEVSVSPLGSKNVVLNEEDAFQYWEKQVFPFFESSQLPPTSSSSTSSSSTIHTNYYPPSLSTVWSEAKLKVLPAYFSSELYAESLLESNKARKELQKQPQKKAASETPRSAPLPPTKADKPKQRQRVATEKTKYFGNTEAELKMEVEEDDEEEDEDHVALSSSSSGAVAGGGDAANIVADDVWTDAQDAALLEIYLKSCMRREVFVPSNSDGDASLPENSILKRDFSSLDLTTIEPFRLRSVEAKSAGHTLTRANSRMLTLIKKESFATVRGILAFILAHADKEIDEDLRLVVNSAFDPSLIRSRTCTHASDHPPPPPSLNELAMTRALQIYCDSDVHRSTESERLGLNIFPTSVVRRVNCELMSNGWLQKNLGSNEEETEEEEEEVVQRKKANRTSAEFTHSENFTKALGGFLAPIYSSLISEASMEKQMEGEEEAANSNSSLFGAGLTSLYFQAANTFVESDNVSKSSTREAFLFAHGLSSEADDKEADVSVELKISGGQVKKGDKEHLGPSIHIPAREFSEDEYEDTKTFSKTLEACHNGFYKNDLNRIATCITFRDKKRTSSSSSSSSSSAAPLALPAAKKSKQVDERPLSDLEKSVVSWVKKSGANGISLFEIAQKCSCEPEDVKDAVQRVLLLSQVVQVSVSTSSSSEDSFKYFDESFCSVSSGAEGACPWMTIDGTRNEFLFKQLVAKIIALLATKPGAALATIHAAVPMLTLQQTSVLLDVMRKEGLVMNKNASNGSVVCKGPFAPLLGSNQAVAAASGSGFFVRL